jgi:hypothetical protein
MIFQKTGTNEMKSFGFVVWHLLLQSFQTETSDADT